MYGIDEFKKLVIEYERLKKDFDDCAKTIQKYKEVIEQKNREVLERLSSEEEILERLKIKIHQYNQLEAMYAHVCKKYDLLSKSKLGRLTLYYWKLRKRIPKDF
jgi:DNA repair ATPase RecN